ncbi:MAG: gliding motility lipoprotein GldD [Bacteroidetes bacterium]|nr:gliding motility lipoprotein GldD [Bacteroidota bacterium]
MGRKYFSVEFIITFLGLMILFASCDSDYMPKPRGYFRIDLPEKRFQSFDTSFPYMFDYPVYSNIQEDLLSPEKSYWINLEFPQFKGKLHLSYKIINDNLPQYLEDSRTMVFKHIPKASAINNRMIINEEDNVYGLIYEIDGLGTASPYQFYVTDSTNHFLRGALYFNIKPNNDSLAPVIDFIKEDIEQLINTFRWKSLVKK